MAHGWHSHLIMWVEAFENKLDVGFADFSQKAIAMSLKIQCGSKPQWKAQRRKATSERSEPKDASE